MVGTSQFQTRTNQFYPRTKWFQPEVDSLKVILLFKLWKKFFQNATPKSILEFWERKKFEHLTLVILTLPPRSSNLGTKEFQGGTRQFQGGTKGFQSGTRWLDSRVSHTARLYCHDNSLDGIMIYNLHSRQTLREHLQLEAGEIVITNNYHGSSCNSFIIFIQGF